MKNNISAFVLMLIFCWSAIYSQTIINYTTSNSDLPGNNVHAIYIDENGNKWFGTDEGLVYFGQSGDWIIYTTDDKLADNKINDIVYELTDYGSELWLATDKGASVAAFNVDGITSATSYTTENSDIVSNKINAVSVDTRHNRLFGSDTVLSTFTGAMWDYTYAEEAPGGIKDGAFKLNPILCIGSSEPDEVNYVGTEGAGVARVKRDEVDGITCQSFYETDWSGVPSNNIYSVLVDEEGYQWFGTDLGLAYHKNTYTKEDWERYDINDGLINNFVQAIAKNLNDVIWFGTKGGISSFKDGAFINEYTIESGLLSNNINDIGVDAYNNIWLATDKGINVLQFSDGIEDISLKNRNSLQKINTFPNPAIDQTYIHFNTIKNGFIEIAILNYNGKIEKQLFYGYKKTGNHKIIWDLTNEKNAKVIPGIYIVRIVADNYVLTSKLIVL
ncbi:MAG: T9SS type A sorting domain-containing protein [Bacteroidales bacterium]|nr:T9SS type A sorting domain-containing protein [Bacteroidales bacterium]